MTETIVKAQCPHGLDSCEACDRYWWHDAIQREMVRLRDECGCDGYSVTGLAGNLRGFTVTDTAKYVGQMLAWGVLEPIAPLWDFPDTWVKLAR